MERIVTSFVNALRERGVRVSPGESLDAVHALALGGVAGRESVRALLRLTLVKNAHDIPAFEEVFNCFFSSGQCRVPGIQPEDMMGALIHIVEGEQLKAEAHRQHKEEGPTFVLDEEMTAEDLENLLGMEESDDDSDGPEITVQLDGFRAKMEAPSPSDYAMKAPPTVAFHQGLNKSRVEPFTAEELAAVPAIRPDVTFIHAQEAIRRG